VSLDRIWAGWRSSYVSDLTSGRDDGGCVLCGLIETDDDEAALVLERAPGTITVMNLFPYTSGHVMAAPVRHVPGLADLDDAEAAALMAAIRRASSAIESAFAPDGLNVGLNQGAAAGAGVPGHLHFHAMPRWSGDTNFMTSVAEVRVLPEDIRTSYEKLRAAWPHPV
jgi:ATP adenylyltransferase